MKGLVRHCARDPACRFRKLTIAETRVIWYNAIVMVLRIHVPGQLKLFHVIKADNRVGSCLGLGQYWQKQACQNRDDGDHHQ